MAGWERLAYTPTEGFRMRVERNAETFMQVRNAVKRSKSRPRRLGGTVGAKPTADQAAQHPSPERIRGRPLLLYDNPWERLDPGRSGGGGGGGGGGYVYASNKAPASRASSPSSVHSRASAGGRPRSASRGSRRGAAPPRARASSNGRSVPSHFVFRGAGATVAEPSRASSRGRSRSRSRSSRRGGAQPQAQAQQGQYYGAPSEQQYYEDHAALQQGQQQQYSQQQGQQAQYSQQQGQQAQYSQQQGQQQQYSQQQGQQAQYSQPHRYPQQQAQAPPRMSEEEYVQAAMREVLQRVAAASAPGAQQEGPPRSGGESNVHDSVIERVTRATAASASGQRVVSPIGRGGDAVPPLAQSQGQWAHGVGSIDGMLHNVDGNIATASPQSHRAGAVVRVSATSAGHPLPLTQAPAKQQPQQLKQVPKGPTTLPYSAAARRFAPEGDAAAPAGQHAAAHASMAAGEALDAVMQARMAQRASERSASPRPRRAPPSVPPASSQQQQYSQQQGQQQQYSQQQGQQQQYSQQQGQQQQYSQQQGQQQQYSQQQGQQQQYSQQQGQQQGAGAIGSLAQQRIADAKAAQVTSSLHGTLGAPTQGQGAQQAQAPRSAAAKPGSTRAALEQARAQASQDMNHNTYGGVPHGNGPAGRPPASDAQLQSILRDIDGDVSKQIEAAKLRLQQRRLS